MGILKCEIYVKPFSWTAVYVNHERSGLHLVVDHPTQHGLCERKYTRVRSTAKQIAAPEALQCTFHLDLLVPTVLGIHLCKHFKSCVIYAFCMCICYLLRYLNNKNNLISTLLLLFSVNIYNCFNLSCYFTLCS